MERLVEKFWLNTKLVPLCQTRNTLPFVATAARTVLSAKAFVVNCRGSPYALLVYSMKNTSWSVSLVKTPSASRVQA